MKFHKLSQDKKVDLMAFGDSEESDEKDMLKTLTNN